MTNNYKEIKVVNYLNQEVIIKLDEEVSADVVETYHNELTFDGLIDSSIEYGNDVVITLLEQTPNLKGNSSSGIPLPEFEEEAEEEGEEIGGFPDVLSALFGGGNVASIPLGNGNMAGILRIPRGSNSNDEACDCPACKLGEHLSDLKFVVGKHAALKNNPYIIDSVFNAILGDVKNRFPYILEDEKTPFRHATMVEPHTITDIISNPKNEVLSKLSPKEILSKVFLRNEGFLPEGLPEGSIHPFFIVGDFEVGVKFDAYDSLVITFTNGDGVVLLERTIGIENRLNQSRSVVDVLYHILRLANALK